MAEKSKPAKPREPGEPFPDGAIDPELIALRKRIVGAGPVLSASVLVFCGYMMVVLRADLKFSCEPEQPREIDAVADLLDDALHDRFVNVRAVPDRGFVAMVATGEAIGGNRAAPVLGSSDRVWLYTNSNPWTAPVTYHEFYRGRLRPLDDLPFAEGLRDFVAAQPPSPRFISLAAFQEALRGDAATVKDPAGSVLSITPDSEVVLSEVARGHAELIARATGDRLDEAAWNLALGNAGVLPPGGRPYHSDEFALWYRVPAPEGLDAVKAKLVAQNLFAVDVRPVVEARTVKWSELQVARTGLEIGGHEVLWTDLTRISVAVPHRIPDDAVILLTHELPGAYWYLTSIYVVLGLFAMLFGWALMRSFRKTAA